jgi:alkylated DNA nucleotide flippase Atl1
MATCGGAVPWWRVVHADGSPAPGHERAALARYRAEDTPVRLSPDGGTVRVSMYRARWAPITSE